MNHGPRKGFTVLEFLIAIGVIALLISLVLVGLNRARSNSRDQELISHIQTVVLGVQQYYDICKEYPATLEGQETCDALGGKVMSDILPELNKFQFNQGDSRYYYAGLGSQDCIGFHIGVTLNGSASLVNSQKSGATADTTCVGSDNDFDGTQDNVFDIKK